MEQPISPVLVSCYLGAVAKTLEANEDYIDATVDIVKKDLEENPSNIIAQMIMNILVAAKDLIKAHKAMMRCGEKMANGGFIDEPQGSVQ